MNVEHTAPPKEPLYATQVVDSDSQGFRADLLRDGVRIAGVEVHSLSALLERSERK